MFAPIIDDDPTAPEEGLYAVPVSTIRPDSPILTVAKGCGPTARRPTVLSVAPAPTSAPDHE